MSEITQIQRELYILKMQNSLGVTKQSHQIKLLKKKLALAEAWMRREVAQHKK